MNNKEKIAEIILRTNKYEYYLKSIISEYINAKNSDFLYNIMLNTSIISLGNKVKLIRVISHQIEAFNDDESRDFHSASKIVLLKRNVVAHSDSLSKSEQILLDVDYDWNPDGVLVFPMFEEVTPDDIEVVEFNTGKINTQKLDKTYDDFMKYYKKVLEFLLKICHKLPSKNIEVEITEELANLN